MSRSPLAYPLTRGVDGDSGGSADLQTDIMRFMAILALCLVAIFALVQSMPLMPAPVAPVETAATSEAIVAAREDVAAPAAAEASPVRLDRPDTPVASQPPAAVALTRPERVPTRQPRATSDDSTADATEQAATPEPGAAQAASMARQPGFTLRFESDYALTRLVAAQQIGVYALGGGRSRRMTVSESRISFWEASFPNAFHEMEAATVPRPVIEALAGNGVDTGKISWGVTLPGKLSRQLEALLREHSGGALVIGMDGNLRLEAS